MRFYIYSTVGEILFHVLLRLGFRQVMVDVIVVQIFNSIEYDIGVKMDN